MGESLLISNSDYQVSKDKNFKLEKYFPFWRNKKNDPNQITFLQNIANQDEN